MYRALALNLNLTVIFRLVVSISDLFKFLLPALSDGQRHRRVRWNAILLPLVSGGLPVKRVQAALPSQKTGTWRAMAVKIQLLSRYALASVRGKRHISQLAGINISKEFSVCPPPRSPWGVAIFFEVSVSLFEPAPWSPLVNPVLHGDFPPSWTVTLFVAVRVFKASWRRCTTRKSFKAISVPSLWNIVWRPVPRHSRRDGATSFTVLFKQGCVLFCRRKISLRALSRKIGDMLLSMQATSRGLSDSICSSLE